MKKFVIFFSLIVNAINSFAYDETLLVCRVSGHTKALNNIKPIPGSKISVSIRETKGKVAIVVSGEESPFGSTLVVLGFNNDIGDYLMIGNNLSNNSKYSVNSTSTERATGRQDYTDIEISRVTGDIRIMYNAKTIGLLKIVEGKCSRLINTNKF